MDKGLLKLRDLIGSQALDSLRKRPSTVLHIWWASTPSNWYVENGRKQMLWHSSEEENRQLPDLGLFEVVGHSEAKIQVPGPGAWIVGADQGSPEKTTYRLKPEHCLGSKR